ncbi:uncharacterized protein MELLADRAFT_69440 [Melampsora larici-populina 98AG31]|uniref:Uncharacterized protein n=1 Tax=Melampsora larici-populina (strain 98AG31 / pathotype 3-4-7) TaxID=747676 RepID=F4SAR6_MELLP|nr:uncharacterized protein MELLADRAFT_69440 [Melampsora larici-populina 98AG31]EGF98262.1 hypothetical protein MELLADRAFT_69440 [Melampsora larici-populina 98AG31]
MTPIAMILPSSVFQSHDKSASILLRGSPCYGHLHFTLNNQRLISFLLMPSRPRVSAPSSRVLQSRDHHATQTQSHKIDVPSSVTPLKRGRELDPEPASLEDTTEDAGVLVQHKTKREKLLELLDKRIKKKPRLTSQLAAQQTEFEGNKGKRKSRETRSSKSKTLPVQSSATKIKSPAEISTSTQVIAPLSPPQNLNDEVDYTRFDDTQLRNTLRGVGLDTNQMNRDDLVWNCKIYQDLIFLPTDLPPAFGQQPIHSNNPSFSFTPTSFGKESCTTQELFNISSETSKTQVTETPFAHPGATASNLPILEHRRFLYPRPQPTFILAPSPTSKTSKGKGKARENSDIVSDPDWSLGDEKMDYSNMTDKEQADSDVDSLLRDQGHGHSDMEQSEK